MASTLPRPNSGASSAALKISAAGCLVHTLLHRLARRSRSHPPSSGVGGLRLRRLARRLLQLGHLGRVAGHPSLPSQSPSVFSSFGCPDQDDGERTAGLLQCNMATSSRGISARKFFCSAQNQCGPEPTRRTGRKAAVCHSATIGLWFLFVHGDNGLPTSYGVRRSWQRGGGPRSGGFMSGTSAPCASGHGGPRAACLARSRRAGAAQIGSERYAAIVVEPAAAPPWSPPARMSSAIRPRSPR